MRASNSIVAQGANRQQSFSSIINGDGMKNMITKSLGDPRRAASFASTLISTVAASTQLSKCNPNSIISSALKGEGMNLSLALGQYSIVPYGDSANFQISYKGLSQLATRSGQYKDFGVFDVREGEYMGRDMRTRQPIIEWLDDDERENKPLAGFYGFYELANGFFKGIYWSHEKILNHADRYSKAFSKEKYMNMVSGKMDPADAARLRGGSPWYDEPLSEAHMKMCKKTVLIQMLSDGIAPLSLDMQSAFSNENAVEQGGIIYADDPLVIAQNSRRETVTVDVETGEVLENATDVAGDTLTKETKKSSPRGRKASESAPESSEDNIQESFFM